MSYLDLTSLSNKTRAYTNGKHKHVYEKVDDEDDCDEDHCNSFVEHVRSLWRRPTLNEWTFTFMLFLFSSSIVIGKIYLKHDFFDFLDINAERFNKSIPVYREMADKAIIEPLKPYGWLIKAVLSGLAVTALSWGILYNDSNEPGVNPPSPFTPTKKRIHPESSGLQLNYLVGGMLGFLMFLYMCL